MSESGDEIAVREATPSDRDDIARSLARAFMDDPVSEFLFPDAAAREHRLTLFYQAVIGLFGHLGLVRTDDRLRGAAAWQPPSPNPNLLMILPSMIKVGIALRSAWFRLSKLNAAVTPFHPREPHWYLAILGTDPSAQGTGVGSALIRPTLQLCDEEGILAYLESSKEANLSFYQRHGFRVSEVIDVPKGPRLWGMLREPNTKSPRQRGEAAAFSG